MKKKYNVYSCTVVKTHVYLLLLSKSADESKIGGKFKYLLSSKEKFRRKM